MLHQLFNRDVRVVDLRANAVDDFLQVVRRNVGCHSNRDPGGAVDEKIWKRRRKNSRFGPGLVVIGDEIDGVLVHVHHERSAEMGHARFGVTHGRGRVAFDRSEVALAIDKSFAHRPWLRHVHERRINYRFAVRMIITARIAAYFRALAVLSSWKERQIVHRIENAALRWLQSVTRIRQRTRDDYGHRVIKERSRYFVRDVYRIYFFVLVIHRLGVAPRLPVNAPLGNVPPTRGKDRPIDGL